MGAIKRHPPVKLIIGLIFKEEEAFNRAFEALISRFGELDFKSKVLSFTHTNYYEAEFGRGLKKVFIGFKKLIPPQSLPGIKTIANKIEKGLSKGKRRTINIDPGYMDMAKLVLASTKDYKHRIYLNKGIFAEITLFYQNKSFLPWDWTYPDYKSRDYTEIFNKIREIYAGQIKKN